MDNLIQTAQQFFASLDANNTRDWWQANRAPYDTTLKPGALALLDDLAPKLAQMTGYPVTSKLFRPHRDVRFSKDKRPYNTHLHMMWQVAADTRQDPVFFFGIGLDYVTAGAGIMSFEKSVLMDWRTHVDLDTDRITAVLAGVTGKGYGLRAPDLVRVPPPFAKDHPAGDLLRMKGLTASKTVSGTDALAAACADLWPLNDLLISVAAA